MLGHDFSVSAFHLLQLRCMFSAEPDRSPITDVEGEVGDDVDDEDELEDSENGSVWTLFPFADILRYLVRFISCIIYTCGTVTSSLPFHPPLCFGRDAAPDLALRQISLSPRASRRYREDSRLRSAAQSPTTK
ncbi:unnamed protein product [Dicrocoelium dendriticum]|nr:unnamed protein product [Dicrocoelium dendriticum]